ncbi:XRN 5'-3' exonuclease N-terminus-domain-containing protein [Gymnopilus junonius]|uniref:5'-3' exoribonuclease 1 n=1 Tax=Gymnopilus junonius TaxID=109634 RepID=A0A9P5TSC6_GYMJU|nr:XRN 5'-3' exonuclease N-terminus-domain-containing protein [Gymnopilus junonius]
MDIVGSRERYPLTSQLIQENKIPEFDNLYLDFNGIIHNCSHPNDEDAHFRLSEEQIFTSIFAYVDHLFGKIKPKKLFFMAVDGVAPRAKMNQQRSRRFRTAKEAKEVREKAEAKGEKLPEEKAFDSNCITPGTPFMARLSEQLRYFVNKKITEDSNWRNIEVVLSGHEVPGEGEHKIMEYIRLSRAQPDYNPNIRHCLYGLDADLIMLGLLSHDPHFCLLREEVKFGPASRKKSSNSLESINFYLLHLSLMREYLDLEFRDIEPVLPFEYSLERVLDDFILLAVFVGNDFLPNLPDLHIHENGLEKLFDVYKKVLPAMGGYINENGTIDTKRLQMVLNEMAEWEQEIFEGEYADMNWYKGKQEKHIKQLENGRNRGTLVLTKSQREIFEQVKAFVVENREAPSQSHFQAAKLALPNAFPARDRQFINKLSDDLHLSVTWDEYDEQDVNLVTWRLPRALDDAETKDVEDEEDGDDSDWEDAEDDAESRAAVDRVLNKYEKAPVEDPDAEGTFDERYERYYKGKLEISYDDEKAMHDLVYTYVEGLQWVMHYYFNGVASWGWFYNYHYAPRISDLTGVDQMTFNFDLGKPFRPFEQLMGQDLNGKKQDWEAIVKIPFINQDRLLKAMASREHRLTPEEKQRNSFGTSTKFRYNTEEATVYPSSLPGFSRQSTGLREGVALGVEALAGFPSLKTLPHTAALGYHGVNVHGSESRNKSMIVHIQNPFENAKPEDLATKMIGERIFMGWPFLQEGQVVAVSDSLFKYEKMVVTPRTPARVVSNPHAPQGLGHWKSKAERIETYYSKRCGVITGNVDILLHVRPLKGLKRLESGAFVKDYEGPNKETEQAVQMCLSEVASEDPRFLEREAPPLSEEFPDGSKIFFLGEHAYGVAAQVSSTTDTALSVILAFFPSEKAENDKFKAIVDSRKSIRYYPSFKAADQVGITGRALGKITSSFMVITSDNQKTNLGLSLKFEAKALKVIDYSRKEGRNWDYSQKTVDLINEYKAAEVFPGPDPDGRVKEVKSWLKSRGVRDFEPVSLFCDQLTKPLFEAHLSFFPKETVTEIEALADTVTKNKSSGNIKKAIVKGIPRQAVLKPSHAVYRLQNQHFALGDRVTMVQDSGGVPLSVKGVVIGLNAKSMDVVWDVPFMSGVTLGDRCSQYRGSTVEFNTCLNLTNPQFVTSTNPKAPPPVRNQVPFKPRFGPHPAINPPPGQASAAGFRPAPQSNQPARVHIMANPNRGGRGGHANGRGGPPPQVAQVQTVASDTHTDSRNESQSADHVSPANGGHVPGPSVNGRGFHPRGRGGFVPGFRGGRGFIPNGDRGRGAPRGGFRGRGRGSFAAPLPS